MLSWSPSARSEAKLPRCLDSPPFPASPRYLASKAYTARRYQAVALISRSITFPVCCPLHLLAIRCSITRCSYSLFSSNPWSFNSATLVSKYFIPSLSIPMSFGTHSLVDFSRVLGFPGLLSVARKLFEAIRWARFTKWPKNKTHHLITQDPWFSRAVWTQSLLV